MTAWKINTAMVGMAILALTFVPDRSTADDTQTAAEACGACHQGKRSLAGKEHEQLAAKIRSILDGKIKHPSLRLDDTSDDAIAKLAMELAEAE